KGVFTPGNLVCYKGRMVSQGIDHVDLVYQSETLKQEIAERLKVDANDVEMLSLLAEIKRDEGSLGEAIDLFRRSYQLAQDTSLRDDLVGCLLEGLEKDFAHYRNTLKELDGLAEKGKERSRFLRLAEHILAVQLRDDTAEPGRRPPTCRGEGPAQPGAQLMAAIRACR
ncbi:hypothetical protein B4Q13_25505, partial [Lacticaseibacillus rhamnosus]